MSNICLILEHFVLTTLEGLMSRLERGYLRCNEYSLVRIF